MSATTAQRVQRELGRHARRQRDVHVRTLLSGAGQPDPEVVELLVGEQCVLPAELVARVALRLAAEHHEAMLLF